MIVVPGINNDSTEAEIVSAYRKHGFDNETAQAYAGIIIAMRDPETRRKLKKAGMVVY